MTDPPPEVRVDRLTEHQIAMLAVLGNPPEVAERTYVAIVVDTPEGLRRISNELQSVVIRRHACPIVDVAGSRRVIMPNGDIWSVKPEEG